MDDKKAPVTEEGKKLVDQTLINSGVDNKTQDMINKPMVDPTGVDDTDLEYMQKVVAMVENGRINIHTPSTLMNSGVYKELDEMTQGKVDLSAINLLSEIRQIKKLWDEGDKGESFQIQNLVLSMRTKKQNIEKQFGDCYII